MGAAVIAATLGRGLFSLDNEGIKIFPLGSKLLVGLFIISSLLGHLIPSKQDMAIIAAGGITYNIATSDKAAELGNKSIELLSKKLDQMIADPVKATKDAKAIVEEVKK